MEAPALVFEILRRVGAQGRRAAVVGGSIGGLTAALLLRDAGWDVDVFERSAVLLEGRGGGIVGHPTTMRYLVERAGLTLPDVSAAAPWLRYLDAGGGVAHEEPCSYRFTSYDALYRPLLERFGRERYHLAEDGVGLDGTELVLASGRRVTADLVVFADGINSAGRRLLSPATEPVFAGYVAWRGTVAADRFGPAATRALRDAITYCVLPDGHSISYPIPGQLQNWLWYWNVEPGSDLDELTRGGDGRFVATLPPGHVPAEHVAELVRRAEASLPPVMAEVIERTPEPYIQVIVDIEPERMAAGRACLIGDAAFTARPHIAVGTAKAAENAWTLAAELDGASDGVEAALQAWSESQVALGTAAVARSRDAGIRLQNGSWQPGEPLPYGLYSVGDSEIGERD